LFAGGFCGNNTDTMRHAPTLPHHVAFAFALVACGDGGRNGPAEFVPVDNGAPLEITTVFTAGESGYHTFRIPAIVRAADGTLLALAEGRVHSAADHGDIDLVLKRSPDHGQTWEPLQVVADLGQDTIGNPMPIVVRESGRVVLPLTSNRGEDILPEINMGTGEPRRIWVTHSDDHGANWEPLREISDTTRQEGFLWYATGPGHGLQLSRGPHAGRLIAACDHSEGDWMGQEFLHTHLLLSDDLGQTWRIGAVGEPVAGAIAPNESSALELADGRIYVNSRNEQRGGASRAIAFSSDGGESLDGGYSLEPAITTAVVQGSVLQYSATDRGAAKNRLIYTGPAHPEERREMRVRLSVDEAQTWDEGVVIHDGPAAYSDPVVTADSRVGVLFEAGDEERNYARIDFARFGILWLEAQ